MEYVKISDWSLRKLIFIQEMMRRERERGKWIWTSNCSCPDNIKGSRTSRNSETICDWKKQHLDKSLIQFQMEYTTLHILIIQCHCLKWLVKQKIKKKINLFSKILLQPQWCDNAAENIWGQSMTLEVYIILQTAFDKQRSWQTNSWPKHTGQTS